MLFLILYRHTDLACFLTDLTTIWEAFPSFFYCKPLLRYQNEVYDLSLILLADFKTSLCTLTICLSNSAQSGRNLLALRPHEMATAKAKFHVGNNEFQSVDDFFSFVKDLRRTVTAEDLPSTYASIGADLLRSCGTAVGFMDAVVAQFVDLIEEQFPGLMEETNKGLKSNEYKDSWNTLRKIRATQKSDRALKATGQQGRIIERWGDVTKYFFAKEPGQKYIQALDTLSTLYPDWQVAKGFINHVLLERRRRPITGQRFDLRPGVADATHARDLARKVHRDNSVIPKVTEKDLDELYQTSKIRLGFNEWGLLQHQFGASEPGVQDECEDSDDETGEAFGSKEGDESEEGHE